MYVYAKRCQLFIFSVFNSNELHTFPPFPPLTLYQMSFLQSLPYLLHFQVDRVFFFDYYCCIQYTHICINPAVGGVHEVSRVIHCTEQPIRNHLWERLIVLLLSANNYP